MPKPVPDAADDFCDLNFGDSRLGKRLQTIVAALQERPTHGFPEAMGSDAGAEAF